MADPLDLLTITEARRAVGVGEAVGTYDATIEPLVTAVSRLIDSKCGPVVTRTVTEVHDGGSGTLFLRQAPVSKTAATTITSVTEYASGTATVLAAETLTASTADDYLFDRRLGLIERRASWGGSRFAAGTRVEVVYSAGRYANTASVDARFKRAAVVTLQHFWNNGAASSGQGVDVDFGTDSSPFVGVAPWALPKAARDLLWDELLPPVVA